METNEKKQEIAVKISDVKKIYRLGQIGGGTLQADLQSWWARIRGKEDPNVKIGQEEKARLVGQTFMALNGVDMTIYKGEAVGIIGGNGAGKSTLLKLLSQVTAPSTGKIELYGRVASMLEVGTGFNGEMTGRENIYMNGAILGMTKEEIDAKMEDIIEFSEVRDFIDTPVKRYSSGMYVKLAFSVAAHLDSEIMIMDEVLAVGDMAFQKKCLDKMREAASKQGRTVLYVSHNMNTIRQLCDRCIVLDKGKVIFQGDVEAAIGVYMGISQEFKSHYEYTKEHHKSKYSTDKFVINELDILNAKSNNIYYSSEHVELVIKYSAKKEFENLRFRFVIHFQDGAVPGTMISEKPICTEIGEKQSISVKLDTSHLMPGKYNVSVIAFQTNEFGAEQIVDGVYPGFYFEIADRLERDTLRWLPQYWGHTRLHDAIVSLN